MTVHYSDEWLTVLHGDVRDELRTLPDESVHCVITSPPYWGLRDYGTASWEGGDEACDHIDPTRGRSSTYKTTDAHRADASANLFGTTYRSECGKCGAVPLPPRGPHRPERGLPGTAHGAQPGDPARTRGVGMTSLEWAFFLLTPLFSIALVLAVRWPTRRSR